MKVPLEWLKEFVTVRLSPEALARRLTMVGLEVTGIEPLNGDTVLDLEITPNRADCLSIIGVAREVAVITGQRLKPLGGTGGMGRGAGEAKHPRPSLLAPRPVIRIEDRKGCERYIGRLIEEVRIAPSPGWMQRRLIACGARPINAVVDITNYVLLEYGQPLHAFDFNRLAQGTILVRRAKPHEPLTTLDGVSRTLSSEMLVIADAKHAVAVAGVMGGMGSEVTLQTTDVLLESALFNPITVRRTARNLGLASESSYRFERGVDPAGVETASLRATSLICALAGGKAVTSCDVGVKPSKRTAITLEPQRLSRWLGMRINPTTVRTTLTRLSCRVIASGTSSSLRVAPPSFRQDLTQDVDLYEELARIAGYDRVPTTLPTSSIASERGERLGDYWRIQSLKCLCASLGLTEVITWSLVSEADLSRCGYDASHAAHLANPLSRDHAYLRPSLLIGLLQAIRRNLTQGASGVHMFEVGSVIRPADVSGTVESLRVGLALSGVWSRDWHEQEPCDFFRLKGLIEAVVSRLCERAAQVVRATHPWAEPGQGAEVQLEGRTVGVAGQISRTIVQAMDIEQDAWFAELSGEDLLASKRPTAAIRVPMMFPPARRDLSILVSAETTFELVYRAVRDAGGALASRVELIDRYTGPQIPSGKSSLTFSIEYRDASHTLTAAEIDGLHHRIGQTLVNRFNAQLR
jgi:phenylalanyl-tRNA synthetase beta chain